MKSSIRRRLVLALAGVSLFTLVVVGIVFYLFLGSYVIERQKDLLLDQAVEVAEQLQGISESVPATPGAHGRGMMLSALLRADLRVLPSGSGIAVYTDDTLLASVGAVPTRPEAVQELQTEAQRLGAEGPSADVVDVELGRVDAKVTAIVAVAPFELSDSTTGFAVVTLARADAFSYRSGILRTLLISGAVAVGLAVIVGLGLGVWMTRPLRRLSVAAQSITDGSYDQPVTGSYPGEIQELADDLEAMRQEVRRSEASLRGFVSSAAHELRTPLTSIQGFSQALLDGTAATEEERTRSAAAVYKESTRLRRLVDTLLTLSRYDSHEFQPSLASVSVGDLVGEEAERLLQAGLVEPGRVVLHKEGASTIVTDADMLRQVIANLLHNAVQYGEGGPVEVTLKTDGDRMLIDVANGGALLTSEERQRLFSRFYRGDAGRKTEGFGLGLALVWEICDLLGGRVEVVEDDSLNRFRVTLPVSPERTDQGAPAE